jgi:large subunit ribosomal protein L2
MPIIKRRPRNPSLRRQSFVDSSDITKKTPEKSLVFGLRKKGGRNAFGRITVRHRGGGAFRRYRLIDFKRQVRDIPGKIVSVEYDPNRNVRIALVVYKNGEKRYILKPEGLEVGATVVAAHVAEVYVGNAMPLKNIPDGYTVHNIEIRPGVGGTFARSAGTSAQIVSKAGNLVTLKLPSGEVRFVHEDCWATIGQLGNTDHKNISLGKAGRSRHLGIRPTVRGVAMNSCDHPHGGGRGKSKGNRHPVTPWGKGCKGTKTRKERKKGSRFIVKRRK